MEVFFICKGKQTWISIRNTDLAKLEQDGKNDILSMLKHSYYHLEPPLKHCFSYCALFPKGDRIEKTTLVSMWMAHSIIAPSHDQDLEDVAEEYFMTLLQRCFFQDVERDDLGEILSSKIHDLMLDLAQEVAGKEVLLVVDDIVSQVKMNTRHLSLKGEIGIGSGASCVC